MYRYVAVYGTLRDGGGDPNFRERAGLTEVTLVSVERIPGFKLVNRRYHYTDIPIILRTINQTSTVKVEIHKISQEQLDYMDRQEGINSDHWFYTGTWVKTENRHMARLYLGKQYRDHDIHIDDGDWIAYQKRITK